MRCSEYDNLASLGGEGERAKPALVCVARRVTNFLRGPHHTPRENSGAEESPFQSKLHSHVHMKEPLSRA